MTPLRMRMTEDMRVVGLAAGTQAVYIDGVRRLAKHYRWSLEKLSEEEVRLFAKQTCAACHRHGIWWSQAAQACLAFHVCTNLQRFA